MDLIKAIKRQKFYFYLSHVISYLIPSFLYRNSLKKKLVESNANKSEISKRLAYYVSPTINFSATKNWVALKNFKRPKKGSMYFFDLVMHTKYFKPTYKIQYKFGDVTENFDEPTLVKSRPIDHNGNSVLMKLDSLRHFHFIKDEKSFEQKNDLIVWRGEIHKENRRLLVEKFHNHPLCNIGDVSRKEWVPIEWKKNYLSIKEQLNYKFILSIEGIDVATNLKWILSSNSLCIMPKPIFETWFMEGLLIPDYHYVLVKDDYSDLIEKRDYYLNHPEKALQIIKNAHDWVAQFKNNKQEKQLSLLVLNQFFKQTNQMS